jgi:hypothetical protein
MALRPDEVSTLTDILTALDGLDLPERSAQFVKDQAERFEKYGADMNLSVKQWDWLKDLYMKNVGPLP